MLHGRIRKFALENSINLLTENDQIQENIVRFAVIADSKISKIKDFLTKIIPDIEIKLVSSKVQNPVLSKLKINLEEMYTI